ncbi:uncharacterized protein LOC136715835 [Amia ocellicauda]|uniref:uncharacterized protein LOC136715835 n=1 Tax=Amia ocellicauda TaxID=2972642 RepID=UPI0034645498
MDFDWEKWLLDEDDDLGLQGYAASVPDSQCGHKVVWELIPGRPAVPNKPASVCRVSSSTEEHRGHEEGGCSQMGTPQGHPGTAALEEASCGPCDSSVTQLGEVCVENAAHSPSTLQPGQGRPLSRIPQFPAEPEKPTSTGMILKRVMPQQCHVEPGVHIKRRQWRSQNLLSVSSQERERGEERPLQLTSSRKMLKRVIPQECRVEPGMKKRQWRDQNLVSVSSQERERGEESLLQPTSSRKMLKRVIPQQCHMEPGMKKRQWRALDHRSLQSPLPESSCT